MLKLNTKDLIKFYLKIVNQQAGHIKIFNYSQFLKSAVKFKNNGIIEQNENLLIDVSNQTIQFLLENANSYLNVERFKDTFKHSKHWRNIKNINFDEIYFTVFDFNNKKQIDQFHVKCFSFNNEQKLNEYYEDFKTFCSDLFGFYNSIDNKHIVCINSKAVGFIKVLYHEISHFIQKIGNIRIISKELKQNQKQIIKNDVNDEYFSNKVVSYFSGYQFIPHVDDMIIDFKNMIEIFYKDKKYEFFNDLNIFLKFCKMNSYEQIIKNEFFQKFLKVNKNCGQSLIMLIYSYKMKFKFQKLFNILYNRLFELI